MVQVFIGLSATFVLLLCFLQWLYWFQVKEYRLDRVRCHIADCGFLRCFYSVEILVPAIRKARVIAHLIAVSLITYIFAAWLISTPRSLIDLVARPLLILLLPVVAFAVVAGVSFATSIPVLIYRRMVINKAAKMVSGIKPFVIAIAGSYGKSITKDYLAHILNHYFDTAKTIRNYNTDIGVALSVCAHLRRSTQYFVAEIGAYKRGEIEPVCRFLHHRIGVITALGDQHVALFGSRDKLIQAETEVIATLPSSGIAVVPDALSRGDMATVRKRTRATIHTFHVVPHNAHQTAVNCATTVASLIGLNHAQIQEALSTLEKRGEFRLRTHVRRGYRYHANLYSTNTAHFLAIIHHLKSLKFEKKFILTRGIIELGEEKQRAYSKIVSQAAQSRVKIFTNDRAFLHVAEQLHKTHTIVYSPYEHTLVRMLNQNLDEDVVLCLEGRLKPQTVRSLIGVQ
jgi:UDP-N-acetylmuramoyl-tripeptide--D-alanyl-D-alanine ligase